MTAALTDSGRARVDAVSLHGDGGATSDLGEAGALRDFATETGVWPTVYATKGAHGNLVSAAGPLAVVGALAALEEAAIPPSRNCDETDPACALRLTTDGARTAPGMQTVMVNALGVFGEAASLMIARGA
jgi:3-oxoacyl-(acyl-carrier-protein) synthase